MKVIINKSTRIYESTYERPHIKEAVLAVYDQSETYTGLPAAEWYKKWKGYANYIIYLVIELCVKGLSVETKY